MPKEDVILVGTSGGFVDMGIPDLGPAYENVGKKSKDAFLKAVGGPGRMIVGDIHAVRFYFQAMQLMEACGLPPVPDKSITEFIDSSFLQSSQKHFKLHEYPAWDPSPSATLTQNVVKKMGFPSEMLRALKSEVDKRLAGQPHADTLRKQMAQIMTSGLIKTVGEPDNRFIYETFLATDQMATTKRTVENITTALAVASK